MSKKSHSSTSIFSKDKNNFFDHRNPFKINFDELSKVQEQKSFAKDVASRKNYQIIRRKMETKKLKTEVKIEIEQQERDEKFCLPKLFLTGTSNEETIPRLSKMKTLNDRCKVVPMMDKEEIHKESKRHYQFKEDKLRQKIRDKKLMQEKIDKEEIEKLKKEEENFIFRLADESLPFESDNNINTLSLPTNKPPRINENFKFDEEELGISSGQKIGNRVILRNFHDRLYSEPRGRINLHMKESKESTCLTHKQWLDGISNDPKITSQPPKGKLIACLKPSIAPNDDRTMLFERQRVSNKAKASIGPIKQHIRRINEKMESRNDEKTKTKSKFFVEKRLDTSKRAIMSIVKRISSNSTDRLKADGFPKLKTKTTTENSKKNQSKVYEIDLNFAHNDESFSHSEINANKTESSKFEEVKDNVQSETESSSLNKAFNEIIANKLKNQTDPSNLSSHEDTNEIEKRQESLESSSNLSSDGTYFSNDSGSYLLVHDQKIPKSQLNIAKKFQNRSLVTTEEVPLNNASPYIVDDKIPKKLIIKIPDRFHTCQTRSCSTKSERVKIESDDNMIGDGSHKFQSKVATDYDEEYFDAFYQSSSQYRFLPRTELKALREVFRKKMDILFIKENITFERIYAESNEEIMKGSEMQIEAYNKFLDTLQETKHRQTMKLLEQVKFYFQETNNLRTQHEILFLQIEPRNMKVFYLANEYINRVKLEDFQYILMPLEWREQHDHLHRTIDGSLENFRESIEQRGKRNLWDRDSVSVETIMNFINDTYSIEKSTQKQKLFTSGRDVLQAVQTLQMKSFKVLQKFTYASIMLTKLNFEEHEMEIESKKFITRYEESAAHVVKGRTFVQAKVDEIQSNVKRISEKPLEESFGAPLLCNVTALCSHLFEEKLAGDPSAQYFTANEKLSLIEKNVLNLIAELDKIPRDVSDEIEKKVRSMRTKKIRVAERAYKIELNIEFTMTQIQRLLAKPAKREKRKGKLPRSVLLKPPRKPKKVVPLLSPLEEKYAKAFMELSDNEEFKFDENVLKIIQRIKNESVPFYLDHFLEKRGFKIGKLNELQSEDILKDEERFLKYKDVIPEVRKQVQLTEELHEAIKEQNIQRTIHMY